LFGLATTINIITTIICGMFFGSNTHEQEGVEIIFFLIFVYECIAYFACFVLSMIGTDLKHLIEALASLHGDGLSVVTCIIFFLIAFC